MKLAEYLEDLDPTLAANLERALDAVRGEFEDKIASTIRETLSAAAEEASAKQSEEPAPALSPELTLDAADELRLAALEIDAAASQSDILERLSRGVLRFSSRVAIFVNREQEMRGWSASGFGAADERIKDILIDSKETLPAGVRLSEGAVALSAADCAAICDPLGAEQPSMGIFLPFVLGNQVVGTVYCDRLRDESFSVSALQLLTYIAGQTLETLPVRKRESTATLALAGGFGQAEPVQAPAQREPVEQPSADTPEPEAAGIATREVTAEPDTEPEPVVEPEPVAEPEPVVDDFQPEQDNAEDYLMEAPDRAAVEASPPDVDASEGLPAPDADLPPLTAVDEETTRPGSLEPEPIPEPPQPPIQGPPVASEGLGATTAEPAISSSSTQVAPPADLQGPGWAFTGGNEASDATSESAHEEAQRLARLLVTEIKLYNEDAVANGRRDGDVYSLLREDIDRSRQIFEDRIDPAVRSENDYFQQALVRILAGGDPGLLGI